MATPVESAATIETKVSTLGGCSFIYWTFPKFQFNIFNLLKEMATRSDESMKHGDENLQEDGLPKGDHLGETANGGADGGSKRGVPESTEKVSPEKKVMRKDLLSPPIEPRRLELGVNGDDGDSKKIETPESLEAPVLPQVQPSPSPVPVPTETSQLEPEPVLSQNDLVASLTRALDKIAKLEMEVEKQKQQKQVEPVVAEATPMRGCSAGTPSSAVTSKPGGGDEGSDDSDENESGKGDELLKFPNGQKIMSHDALRMRLRRLCEVKPKTNKCHVDSETCEQYRRGGEGREWLEIALIEALQKVGPDSRQHKKLRVPHL